MQRLRDLDAGEGGADDHAAVLVDDQARGARRVAADEARAGVRAGLDVERAYVQARLGRGGQRMSDRRDLRVGEDHARRERPVGDDARVLAEDHVGGEARPGTCPCA